MDPNRFKSLIKIINISNEKRKKHNEDVWDASEDYNAPTYFDTEAMTDDPLNQRTRPKPRMTLWQAVKNYFDSYEAFYTRSDLRNYLDQHGYTYFQSSMDTYRNYLTKAGYVRSVNRSVYRLIKEIPVDLTITEVKLEAYGDTGNRLEEVNFVGEYKAERFIDMVKPRIKTKRKYAKKKRDNGFIQEDEFQV